MHMRRWLYGALFTLLFSSATTATPDEFKFSEDLLNLGQEEWLGAYMGADKVGYAMQVTHRIEKDGVEVYRQKSVMKLRVVVMGETMEIEVSEYEDFSCASPYQLVAAGSVQKQGEFEQVVALTRREDKFHVTVKAAGEVQQRTMEALEFSLRDALALSTWLEEQRDAGEKLGVKTFDLDELRLSSETYTVQSRKTSVAAGVPLTFYELQIDLEDDEGFGTMRVTDKGETLSVVIGGIIELRQEPEETAKKLDSKADLFVLGSVKIDRPVGDPDTLTELIVEADEAFAVELPEKVGQKIDAAKNGKAVIRLGPQHGKPVKATEEEIEKYLRATVTIPSDNLKVIEMSKRAVGDAKTPKLKVERLVKFVSEYVRDEYHSNPLTVLDVIEKRQGDCTEHSMLFAALARAAGIPCRETGGLIYMGDDMRSFGGHAWNEVVLDGVWIPIDATWEETTVNPTHIAFSDEGAGELVLLQQKGSLKLIEAKHRQADAEKPKGEESGGKQRERF